MTVDPGQDRSYTLAHDPGPMPQFPPGDLTRLARPLTIDDAYGRAYGDLRRLMLSFCDNILGDIESTVTRAAVEAVAKRLERELAELAYGDELAARLAHPE